MIPDIIIGQVFMLKSSARVYKSKDTKKKHTKQWPHQIAYNTKSNKYGWQAIKVCKEIN